MGYDFSGYKQLMGPAEGQITEVGCWPHARRKFHDLHQTGQSKPDCYSDRPQQLLVCGLAARRPKSGGGDEPDPVGQAQRP